MKHIDIPDGTVVQVDDNVITYQQAGHHYMVRFPAKPGLATLTVENRPYGRKIVTIGRLDKAQLAVAARAEIAEAIFRAVGGVLPNAG